MTSPQPDATEQDKFAQNTDTSPTSVDGPQDIAQDPISEDDTDAQSTEDDGPMAPVPADGPQNIPQTPVPESTDTATP